MASAWLANALLGLHLARGRHHDRARLRVIRRQGPGDGEGAVLRIESRNGRVSDRLAGQGILSRRARGAARTCIGVRRGVHRRAIDVRGEVCLRGCVAAGARRSGHRAAASPAIRLRQSRERTGGVVLDHKNRDAIAGDAGRAGIAAPGSAAKRGLLQVECASGRAADRRIRRCRTGDQDRVGAGAAVGAVRSDAAVAARLDGSGRNRRAGDSGCQRDRGDGRPAIACGQALTGNVAAIAAACRGNS